MSCSRPLLVGLVTGAVFLVTASHADPPSAPLSMHLVGLRTDKGKVGCALYDSERGFPKDPGAARETLFCGITTDESRCTFSPIPAGTYAVACFHDENGNGKIDLGLFGIPKEGVVTSNQAKGFMGPPKFRDARFAFSGAATELTLKMGY